MSQAGVLGRKQSRHAASRRKGSANRPAPVTPVSIVSVTKVGSVLTAVLNQPVALKGLPALTTNLAVTLVSAALSNPTTLVLTFSGAITTATGLNIPFEEPAIRSASGGYLNPGTFPV